MFKDFFQPAVDECGRQLAAKTLGTATTDHLRLLCWAGQFGPDRVWAVEDCRHLSRRLEHDLLRAAERIVRVPLKLMAHARDSARTYGKSDPIDALAIARAALREPELSTACLDGPEREVRLLTDHRETLVAPQQGNQDRSLTGELGTVPFGFPSWSQQDTRRQVVSFSIPHTAAEH